MSEEVMVCNICGKEIDGKVLKDRTDEYVREMAYVKKDLLDDVHVCSECGREHILEHRIKTYKPIFDSLFQSVNNTLFDWDGIDSDAFFRLFTHQHRSLQADMIYFMRKVLKKVAAKAGDAGYVDPRNDWAYEWAKKISAVEPII